MKEPPGSGKPPEILTGVQGKQCPGCGYELTGLAVAVCPECGRGFSVAELERLGRRRVKSRRFLIALATNFVVMYTPYSWLLFMDYPWSDYRWVWIKMWLGLPALLPSHRLFDRSEAFEIIAAHVMSVLILAAATWIASRGWKRFGFTVVILAFVSIWNGIGLYHAFRM